MKIDSKIVRKKLRGGTALQALALIGASAGAVTMAAAPAAAQDFQTVTASGRVTDSSGAVLPGATVVLTSEEQGFTRTVTVDSNGTYRIPNLPQGDYSFRVSAEGYSDYQESGVALARGSSGNSFRLAAGTTSTADSGDIVVTGERVRVSDFDRTTVGGVVDVADIANRVPVARNLNSVVLLTPGTSAGDNTFGALPIVSGSSVSENAYFLNGLNITDFRQGLGAVDVPFQFYDTIEVKSGGVPAEFGRFTGGFINATSKSGGNQFHGEALFNWIPDDLYEDAPNTLVDQNDQDFNETEEAIFSLSGPIIKDHLFFFAFYQSNNDIAKDTQLTSNSQTVLRPERPDGDGGTLPADIDPTTGQPVTEATVVPPYSTGLRRLESRDDSPFYGGKVDFIPFDGHRLEFTYFNSSASRVQQTYGVTDVDGGGYDSRVDPEGPRIGAFQGTTVFETGGENYVGRYTGQFTDWLTVSAAYGKNKRRDVTTSNRPDYPFISDASGDFSPALSGNSLNVIDDSEDEREFYRADVQLYVDFLGSHHFKVGYDRENLTTDATTSYTGGIAYQYLNSGQGDDFVSTPDTLYVSGRTFINGGSFKSRNEAYYLQDSWSLFNDRLTLNLGIRNDKFENDNVNGETYYSSGDTWAPRVAFTLDPTGNGRSKIYGSFSRYYLPIAANTNIRLAGSETDYTRYFLVNGVNDDNTPILGAPITGFPNAQACLDTGVPNCEVVSDGTVASTASTVGKGISPQSVDEYVLGYEQSIGDHIRVGVYGQYRTLNESLEDVAIDQAALGYCRNQGFPDDPNAGTVDQDPNLLGCNEIYTGFTQYVLVNPGSDATIQLAGLPDGSTPTVDFTADELGYPEAKRTYKAITATFDREFDGVWSASASYTYSKNIGNIEGGILSDIGQTDSGLTQSYDQPGLTNGSFGYLPTHALHKFKLFGSYAVADWFTLGTQVQAISPRKFGCIGRVPGSVDPFANAYGAAGFYCNTDGSGNIVTNPNAAQNLTLNQRGGVLESDWNFFTNVTAAFHVPVSGFDATFRVDVFNIFNQQNVLDLNELGTTDSGAPRQDYGTPRSYQQPRYVRLQFGVSF